MRVNGEMVSLAREYRDITQDDLATQTKSSQSTIAKIEGGVRHDVPDDLIVDIARVLDFPESFFSQEGERMGFGSSAFFYRKRATIQAADRRRIHSIVNLTRLAIKRLLPHVEIRPKRELPQIDIDDHGGRAADVARALRAVWQLPDGPVKNLTVLVESAGVLIVPCRFDTRALDATSMRLADMPPLVFMNTDVPGDRWRYTLCHELAHLVMHANRPHELMEEEADAFAAEFLVPSEEIRPQFARLKPLRYEGFLRLKRFWRVSVQMLIRRARDLGFLTDEQYRYQMIQISKRGERLVEPEAIELEQPSNLAKMIRTMTEVLEFSEDELAGVVNWGRQELERLFSVASSSEPQRLRLVR